MNRFLRNFTESVAPFMDEGEPGPGAGEHINVEITEPGQKSDEEQLELNDERLDALIDLIKLNTKKAIEIAENAQAAADTAAKELSRLSGLVEGLTAKLNDYLPKKEEKQQQQPKEKNSKYSGRH